MKIKHLVVSASILVSFSTVAQKEELKKLKKLYDKQMPSTSDLAEYKANLDKLQTLATEEGDKVYYEYYRASYPFREMMSGGKNSDPQKMMDLFNVKNIADISRVYQATLEYEKKVGKKLFTEDILKSIAQYKPMLISGADANAKAKKFQEASQLAFTVYQLDPKEIDMVYYAANYAVAANDYTKALEYYTILKNKNYSGEGMLYLAVNKSNGVEESFGSNKSLRDVSVNSAKTHEKPKDEKIPSKRGEIYKNIALILISQDKIEEAKSAISEARRENPNDESLVLSEADLYLKINDFDTYSKLIREVLEKNPNDAKLVFNLGVISGNAGKLEEAEKQYKRAIEIDPNYADAYLNLSEIILRGDEKFVNEMNSLSTSEKDNKRYEVLKAAREKNFKTVLPYLEKAVDLDGKNEAAKKTLLSVYNALEMTDKYKALKAKL